MNRKPWFDALVERLPEAKRIKNQPLHEFLSQHPDYPVNPWEVKEGAVLDALGGPLRSEQIIALIEMALAPPQEPYLKFAFALQGLIRSIVRGDGGHPYMDKATREIAESLRGIIAGLGESQ